MVETIARMILNTKSGMAEMLMCFIMQEKVCLQWMEEIQERIEFLATPLLNLMLYNRFGAT